MKQSTPGMRMKYSRKKEKMKLSELADKINTPIFILKSYETDRKELPYELARHIATVLHTTAGYILGWEADPFLAEVYEQKTNEEALFDEDLMKTPILSIFQPKIDAAILHKYSEMGTSYKFFDILFPFRYID